VSTRRLLLFLLIALAASMVMGFLGAAWVSTTTHAVPRPPRVLD